MIKKFVLAAFILSLSISCKEDALSKVDPNSQDVNMNTVNSVTQKTDATVPAEGDLIEAQPQVTNGKFPTITFNKKEHDFGEIKEGAKERIQVYQGVVIQRNSSNANETFTVRKISNSIGVERIFPINSPNIAKIEVNSVGKVRRAKLFYLRSLTGKKARIKEKRGN